MKDAILRWEDGRHRRRRSYTARPANHRRACGGSCGGRAEKNPAATPGRFSGGRGEFIHEGMEGMTCFTLHRLLARSGIPRQPVAVPTTRISDRAQDLETTLSRYVWLYNHHLPQKALGPDVPQLP